MAIPAGSEGLTRKSTADWLTDTKTYLQGERLLDIDTGEERVSSGGTYLQAWKNLPYLSYIARISQSGTSAPTAVVVSNNTGLTPGFSYNNVGGYTMSGPWPAGAVFDQAILTSNGDLGILSLGQSGSDITMLCQFLDAPHTQSDDLLTDTLVEIRIYA